MNCPGKRDTCYYMLGSRHQGKWVRYTCPVCPEDCGPYQDPPTFEQPDASSPPELRGSTNVYVFTTRVGNQLIRTVARSDEICPVDSCNSTIRVEVRGNHPNDNTYQARTSVRSTGQVEIELNTTLTGGDN